MPTAPPRPTEEGRFANASGAVLLGGGSTRMGRDKTRLELNGEALATRAARRLQELFEDVLLVGADPPRVAPGRCVPDRPGPRSALRGLVSALEAASTDHVLVLATDLPLVSLELLVALLARCEGAAVVPRDAAGLQPLCALYRRDLVLPVARRRLDDGALSLHGLLGELEVVALEGQDLRLVDPTGHALDNVNTPEEWAALQARLREGGGLETHSM